MKRSRRVSTIWTNVSQYWKTVKPVLISGRVSDRNIRLARGIVVFILGVCSGWVLKSQVEHSRLVTLENVYVDRKLDDWNYWLIPDNGRRFLMVVCRDYAPPDFVQGNTLTWLRYYDDAPVCRSLNPNKHAGYYLRRALNGKAQSSEEATEAQAR